MPGCLQIPAPKSRSTWERARCAVPDGGSADFALDPFARHCLLEGMDELGYLLSKLPEIEAWERARKE